MLVLAAVLGYFGHVAQAAYTRKHQGKAEELAKIRALYQELIALRDLEGHPRAAIGPTNRLLTDVALLRNTKLRQRVTDDLEMVEELYFLRLGGSSPIDVRKVWVQDALDSLAAVARGDRPPQPSSEFENQLFSLDRVGAKLAPSVAVLAETLKQSPEFAERQKERAVWTKKRRAQQRRRRLLFWRR